MVTPRPSWVAIRSPAALAGFVLFAVWGVHWLGIDRLEVTKLSVLLVGSGLALILAKQPNLENGPSSSTTLNRVLSPAIWAAIGVVVLSVALPDLMAARVESWTRWVAAALLFALARRSEPERLGTMISWVALFIALVGIAQALGATWFRGDVDAFCGWPTLAMFGNPGLFGVCSAGALPLTLMIRPAKMSTVIGVVVFAAVVASGSRTAWVMAAVGLLLSLRRTGLLKILIVTACGIGVAAVLSWSHPDVDVIERAEAVPNSEGQAVGRLYLWRVNANLFVEAGPIGAGPEAFQRLWPTAQGEYLADHPDELHFHSDLRHAHVDLIEIAIDWGWIGFLAFLVWVGRLLAVGKWVSGLFWSGGTHRFSENGRPQRAAPTHQAAVGAALRGRPGSEEPPSVQSAAGPWISVFCLLVGGLAFPVLFQSPSLALFAVSAGALSPAPKTQPNLISRIAVVVLLLTACFWLGQRVMSEIERNKGLRHEIALELELARDAYQRAADLDATNPLAQIMRARSLVETDPSQALAAINVAVEHLPSGYVYAVRAVAAERAGQREVADESWRMVGFLLPSGLAP